jgi:integrase
MLDDGPSLAAYVGSRGTYGLKYVEETQLLTGNGTGQNLNGILPQASSFTPPFTTDAEQAFDRINEALAQVEQANVTADGIVLNPTDYRAIARKQSNSKFAPKKEMRTTVDQFAAAAIRLLIFTGCRLGEILNLRWSEVDAERGLLFLPDSKTGRKTVVLAAPAMAILEDLPRAGIYVIAGESAGQKDEKPRADLNRPWRAIRQRASLEDVRLHDLRHSFASVGAGAGLGLPVIGKLLGHTQPSTTQRYAHLDADPVRRAADTIAGRIEAVMNGKKR